MSKLRVLRHKAGLTQVQLAEKSNVSRRTILNIERGHCAPRIQVRQRLLTALGWPISDHRKVFGKLARQDR